MNSKTRKIERRKEPMKTNKATEWFRSVFKGTDQEPAKLLTAMKKNSVSSVLSSIISILIGMIVGSIVILIISLATDNLPISQAGDAIKLVFFGLFSTTRDANGVLQLGFNPVNFGDMLFRATPLIMTGLSVAIAFKTGLFNIGAPGQYLLSTYVTLSIALSIPTTVCPAWIVWIVAFIGGMAAGFVWGAIPGLLKSLLNINEVITCIMTNWIAANLVTWLFDISNLKNANEAGKIGYIMPTSKNGVVTPKLGLDKLFPGSQVDMGILIAILIAVIVYIVLTKTTFGYELKACGANRHAAKYAGIKDKRNIVLSMAIAGSLAGGAAALYWLSGHTEFYWNTSQTLPAVGFNGIPVSLLAANNPIGVIITGIFMSMLNISGIQIRNLTGYNEYVTDIIIAIIVYLSSFSLIIKTWITGGRRKNTKKVEPSIVLKDNANPVEVDFASSKDTKTENEEVPYDSLQGSSVADYPQNDETPEDETKEEN